MSAADRQLTLAFPEALPASPAQVAAGVNRAGALLWQRTGMPLLAHGAPALVAECHAGEWWAVTEGDARVFHRPANCSAWFFVASHVSVSDAMRACERLAAAGVRYCLD